MKKNGSHSKRARATVAGVVIGRARFAKISAVEGIALTDEMKRRAAEFDRRGMPADERRRAIIDAHRKG
jgi:hypothetical protein